MNYSVKKFQENLTTLMSMHKISRHKLHRNTNVPISTIQRLCIEDNPNPTISTLKPIADFFAISVNQLIGDLPLPNERIIYSQFKKQETWQHIPIITWQQAISWASGKIDLIDSPLVSTDITLGEHPFALEISNNDWIGFRKGTVLIIDPNTKPLDRGFVIAYKKGLDSATLKKHLIYDGEVYLEPLNKIFKTVELSNDFIILGSVVQLKLDFNSKNCV